MSNRSKTLLTGCGKKISGTFTCSWGPLKWMEFAWFYELLPHVLSHFLPMLIMVYKVSESFTSVVPCWAHAESPCGSKWWDMESHFTAVQEAPCPVWFTMSHKLLPFPHSRTGPALVVPVLQGDTLPRAAALLTPPLLQPSSGLAIYICKKGEREGRALQPHYLLPFHFPSFPLPFEMAANKKKDEDENGGRAEQVNLAGRLKGGRWQPDWERCGSSKGHMWWCGSEDGVGAGSGVTQGVWKHVGSAKHAGGGIACGLWLGYIFSV